MCLCVCVFVCLLACLFAFALVCVLVAPRNINLHTILYVCSPVLSYLCFLHVWSTSQTYELSKTHQVKSIKSKTKENHTKTKAKHITRAKPIPSKHAKCKARLFVCLFVCLFVWVYTRVRVMRCVCVYSATVLGFEVLEDVAVLWLSLCTHARMRTHTHTHTQTHTHTHTHARTHTHLFSW